MFVTDRVLDIILKAKDESFLLTISSKDESHALAVASLQNEIIGLKQMAIILEEKLKYESARADGLVDRLLVRDARVAAVSPSAVAAAVHKDAKGAEVLRKIFDEINSAGVDFPAPEQRSFEIAGGVAVDPGRSDV